MKEKLTKQQIEEYRRTRIQECSEKLQEILQEYNCDLVGVPQIQEGRIVAYVQIVSKD